MFHKAYKKYNDYSENNSQWLQNYPSSWELKRLSHFFFERRHKVSDVDFPALSVTKKGVVPQLDSAAKSNDGDNRKLVKKGDFVINSRSDRKGSSGLSNLDGSVSIINIVLKPNLIDPLFSSYLLKSHGFVEEYYRVGRGIVADLWTTRFNEMKNILLAVPPLEEQKIIAQFLNKKTPKIDQAIEIKEKQISLLKERKQIIIQEVITKGLNPNAPMKDSGIDWIGQTPAHWKIKRLASFGCFSKGGGFSKSDLSEDGVPAMLYGDIYSKYEYWVENPVRKIPVSVAKKAIKINGNELLFAGSGETREEIGKCILYNSTEAAVAGGDIIIFKQKDNCPLFLSLVLNSHGIIKEKAKSSKGEIVVHTYASKLKNLYVPLPPIDEQNAIFKHLGVYITKTSDLIDIKKQEIENLREYKTSLINSAVTGKIKVV
jgi:type I restriction enzyme S subunit